MTDLKLKYNETQKPKVVGTENDRSEESATGIQSYEGANIGKNVCFILIDQTQFFLNYSYLVSGEYSPSSNSIILSFTTHKITLKGNLLEPIFKTLQSNEAKEIHCQDKRYSSDADKSIITEIIIDKLQD